MSNRDAGHTPLPWRVFKTTDGRRLVGVGAQDGQGILDAGYGVWAWDDAEGIANAEMVVRAVNSHQAMVEALEAARERLQDDAESGAPGWKGAQRLVEQIDAVLAAAAPPVEAKSEVVG